MILNRPIRFLFDKINSTGFIENHTSVRVETLGLWLFAGNLIRSSPKLYLKLRVRMFIKILKITFREFI